MTRHIRVKSMLVLLSACILSLTVLIGCTANSGTPQAGIYTNSVYTVQYSNSSGSIADNSALVTAGGYSCDADGSGIQSGGLPYSPLAGECYFPDLYTLTTYNFDDLSFDCLIYWSPYTTDTSYWEYNANINTGQAGIVGPLAPRNCVIMGYNIAPNLSSNFAIYGSVPSTLTAYASGLSSTYGMPKLQVYNTTASLVGVSTATSVAGNGSSATFPFPRAVSGGGPLPSGFYFVAPKNFTDSTGHFKISDGSYFSIGGNTTLSSAFGVDAVDLAYTVQTCYQGQYGWTCNPPTYSTSVVPMFTQYNANQVSYGQTIPVGVRPVAIRAYNFGTFTDSQNQNTTVTHTGPGNAIVVNSGSNSVSILNIATGTYGVAANIAVGTQPMAVAVNSASTKAYVANYGSGTLSEVNLSTNTVSRTATVGSGLLSVAMDPSGSYVWVGGTNNLYKVSVSTFAVVATYPVSGSVTSLAASNAQNELVYTLVQNCCTPSSTFVAKEVSLSNMGTRGSYAQVSASPYAAYTMNGTLPNAAVIPQASAVSAQFGNGMAASATPTGFVIYDLVSHKQFMRGTTPTPVRGIASDPLSQFAYFSIPDSNEYITVPLPHP